MALNVESLAGRIKKEIAALKGRAYDQKEQDMMAKALAKAVIDEIKANAEVDPGTFMAGSDAVTGKGTVS